LADPVKVKKVKAFPIKCSLIAGTTVVPGLIVKLTSQGFLVEVASQAWKPGERMQCSFEIPVMHHMVSESVVVMKLYNQFAGSGSGPGDKTNTKVVYIVEFHFTGLSNRNLERISAFLSVAMRAPQ
jgi:hypothetical protein